MKVTVLSNIDYTKVNVTKCNNLISGEKNVIIYPINKIAMIDMLMFEALHCSVSCQFRTENEVCSFAPHRLPAGRGKKVSNITVKLLGRITPRWNFANLTEKHKQVVTVASYCFLLKNWDRASLEVGSFRSEGS